MGTITINLYNHVTPIFSPHNIQTNERDIPFSFPYLIFKTSKHGIIFSPFHFLVLIHSLFPLTFSFFLLTTCPFNLFFFLFSSSPSSGAIGSLGFLLGFSCSIFQAILYIHSGFFFFFFFFFWCVCVFLGLFLSVSLKVLILINWLINPRIFMQF